MRRFTRVVLALAALTLGAGSIQLRALSQDPEPAPAVTPEPVEQVIVAPADEPAAQETVAEEAEPVAAPVAAEEAPPVAPAVVETAPLDPPPPSAPTVDTSASYWPPTPVEEPASRERKPSDWIFLAIVALAAVVIVARLTREHRESVSIHEDRFPPASSGPPIVRHS